MDSGYTLRAGASIVLRRVIAPKYSLTFWVSHYNHLFIFHAPQYPLFPLSPNS